MLGYQVPESARRPGDMDAIETVQMEPVGGMQLKAEPNTIHSNNNNNNNNNASVEPIEITGENGFMFDERLGDAVRKYKCLYDKNDAGYKQVDTVVEAAWGEVAKDTGLANAETAKRLFCNLKKRFLKKRLAFRKANVRSRNKEALQRAKDAVDAYGFLTWLTPHIRLRETKSNIAKRSQYNTYIESGGSYEDEELYLSEPGEVNQEDTFAVGTFDHLDGMDGETDYRNSPDDASWSMPTFVPAKERQSSSSSSVNHASGQHSSVHGYPKRTTPVTSHVQVPISQPMITKDRPWKKEKEKDDGGGGFDHHYSHDTPCKPQPHPPPLSDDGTGSPDDDCDLFGKLISAELRPLDPRTKTILKHKIQTLVFEAKISQYPGAPPPGARVVTMATEPPERPLHVTTSAAHGGRWENQPAAENNSPSSPSLQWKRGSSTTYGERERERESTQNI